MTHQPPEPGRRQGPASERDLITRRQTYGLLHDAHGLSQGPVEALAERLLDAPDSWFANAYREHFETASGITLEALLSDDGTLEQLARTKSLGKHAFAQAQPEADAGLLLYFLTVALAQLRFGQSLSTMQPADLEDCMALLAGSSRGPEQAVFARWLECGGDD